MQDRGSGVRRIRETPEIRGGLSENEAFFLARQLHRRIEPLSRLLLHGQLLPEASRHHGARREGQHGGVSDRAGGRIPRQQRHAVASQRRRPQRTQHRHNCGGCTTRARRRRSRRRHRPDQEQEEGRVGGNEADASSTVARFHLASPASDSINRKWKTLRLSSNTLARTKSDPTAERCTVTSKYCHGLKTCYSRNGL